MPGVGRKAKVIMNKQHTLFEEQQTILNDRFESYEVILIPPSGWTRQDMDEHVEELIKGDADIVFLSPVPYMLMRVCKILGNEEKGCSVLLFHRDTRYKATRRGGTPWQLIK